jgi:YesN/AraC family two-component response regulator
MYRLMVVEDEEAIRRGFIEQIRWENYGFSVVGEASNGREALDLIPRLRPDVILVDIMMPVMTGLELISHMNKHFPKIKSVVISGYSDFEYARKSLEYGVSYYLLKPTKDEEIRRVFLSLKESLDLVTNKDRQYEIIERKARESEPYLQEHLFKRLIASECTTGEWREIINTGLLPADTERYGAAVAQANDVNEAEPVSLSHLYKSATLASWIGQYASSSEGVPKIYPIFNDDGTMTILCFAGREDADYFTVCSRGFLGGSKT